MNKRLLFFVLICLCAFSAKAATYALDKELTWDQAKGGTTAFALVSGSEVLYGSGNQNTAMADESTALNAGGACVWKIETSGSNYFIRSYTAAGSGYTVYGSTGYLNAQESQTGVSFILGKSEKTNGQDIDNGAVWTVTSTTGGYYIKNVGNSAYLNGANTSASADKVWKFYSVKETEFVSTITSNSSYPMGAIRQKGKNLVCVDDESKPVVLHGVMDTPSAYFQAGRWTNGVTWANYDDPTTNVPKCLAYFTKIFEAINNPSKGTYCNLFRLHLDPCWLQDDAITATGFTIHYKTNEQGQQVVDYVTDTHGSTVSGEANIVHFSKAKFEARLQDLYIPIIKDAIAHGLYVIIRPPGVFPHEIVVGDYYNEYLKTIWDIVSNDSYIKANAGYVSLELGNEPVHIWPSGTTSFTNYTNSNSTLADFFQPIVNKIRSNGFDGIIWAPGTGWQAEYGGYSVKMLTDSKSNLGFAAHFYPGWYHTTGNDDTPSYTDAQVLSQFKTQIPVQANYPIVITEVDWSPKDGAGGHYNESGTWVVSNYGTWGTGSTSQNSRFGEQFKYVTDQCGNVSYTIEGADLYVDMDKYLEDGTIQPSFLAKAHANNVDIYEACSGAAFKWYREYADGEYEWVDTYVPGSSSSSGETDLTKSMFHKWSAVTADATISAEDGGSEYVLNESTGQPYGTGSVWSLHYADISSYATLAVTVSAGEPRFMLNRDTDDGEAPDHMIAIPNNSDQTAAYETVVDNGDGTKTYNLNIAKIVEDKGYAHLNAIKGANWTNVTVTSMKLIPVDECLKVTTTGAQTNAWDWQIRYPLPTALEEGKQYTIEMVAKAGAAVDIQPIAVYSTSSNKDDWGGSADLQYLSASITTDWSTVSFETNGNYPYDYLYFNIGKVNGDLMISNIKITEKSTGTVVLDNTMSDNSTWTKTQNALTLATVPVSESASGGSSSGTTNLSGTYTITVDGTSRSYYLYIPDNVGTNPALVFSLHGAGGQSSDYSPFKKAVADSKGCIVVYPQGLDQYFAIFGGNTPGWNATGENNEDIKFFKAIISDVKTKGITINEKKIYCCGFSNGGMMTYAAANAASDVFAAFASISGFPMNEFHLRHSGATPRPFLHIHGKADSFVKYEYMPTIRDNMVARLGANPVATVTTVADKYTKNVYAAGTNGFPYIYYEVDGMGHNDSTEGTEDGNSTLTMWNFLNQYTLDSSCDATLKWKEQVDATDYAPLDHGWSIVDGNTLTYGTSQAANNADGNVYHDIQLEAGSYEIRANTTGSGTMTFKLEKIDGTSVVNQTVNVGSEAKIPFTTTAYGQYKLTFSKSSSSTDKLNSVAIYTASASSETPAETNTLQTMFKQWTADDGTGTGTTTDCTYTLNSSTGCVYGQSNVDHLKFADLTKYGKISVTATEGTPRFFFNVGYDSENNANVYNLTITADNTTYLTKSGNTYTVDLVKIVEDYGYAHLNSIKASAYNTEVTVTDIQLQAAGPIDLTFTEEGSKTYDSRYFQVSGEGVSINYETGEVTATQAGGTIYVLFNNVDLSAAQSIKLDATTADPYSDICGTSQIFNDGTSINTWYGSRYNMQNLDKKASINNVEQDYNWNDKMGSVTKIQWNINAAGTMKLNELIITSGVPSSGETEPGETIVSTQRRPVDNKHPMWLVHVDVWNNADPQKIIDLIPDDIKPYVVMNLSLSCSYDDDLEMFKKPQNAIQTYRSWASVCCRNNMFFTCQPASGGRGHLPDDDEHLEETLETMESFFTDYPNFLGWNYAEQFWGFDENSKSSSKAVDRIRLFSKLVPMHKKYGGFLTISFCGNIWSHPVNPIGMMKRNADFLNACKQYPESILWLYKYTTSANWYNNESVTIGPFISGLAQNYGVRYDNCGWNGAIEEFTKEGNEFNGDGLPTSYPGAVGIAPILEQMALNGACVWDGPELIWTECFKNGNNSTVDGYTRRNWGTYPNFDNIWVDMFRKVIDGTIHIASRDEVLARTKVVMKNDVSAANDATSLKINAYAAPIDLYHDLYWQNDPFNARTSNEGGIGDIAGYGNNNFLYYKSTGRYATIPIVIDLFDDKAKNAGFTVINRSDYNSNHSDKVSLFNEKYPDAVISEGDLFVGRNKNALVCYYPFSDRKKNDDGTYKTTSYAKVPLKYNTCTSMDLTFGVFSSAHTKEYSDHIDFYLNNYRADISDGVKTDVIKINGASSKPSYTVVDNRCSATVTESWSGNVYTVTVTHCGPIDLRINCAGSNSRSSSLAMVDDAALSANSIATPNAEDLELQPLVIEAEDFDFKSINKCVTDAYNDFLDWNNGNPTYNYRNVLGQSSMGFSDMGTNTQGSLRYIGKTIHSSVHEVKIKYLATEAGSLNVSINGNSNTCTYDATATALTGQDAWGYITLNAELSDESDNTIIITNAGGKQLYIDNVTFTPTDDIIIAVAGEGPSDCDYYISGAGTVDVSVTSALADASATVIDVQGYTGTDEKTFTSANPNCLLVYKSGSSVGGVYSSNMVKDADNAYMIRLQDGYDFRSPFTIGCYAGSTYTRDLGTNTMGTMALPFALDVTENDIPVYRLTAAGEDVITFSEVTEGTLPAGTVILYSNTAGGETVLKGKDVGITASGLNITETGIPGWYTAQSFTSRVIADVTTDAELKDYDVYGISKGEFVHATKKVTLKPFRAFYLRAKSTNAPARLSIRFSEVDDDETTGISIASGAARATDHYNAAGQRISTNARGIHIIRMSDGTTRKVLKK